MSEQIDETLHRFLDDALSPEEAAAFGQRLADDEDLAEEVETLRLARDLLRADIEAATEAMDFGGLADAVMAGIADVEVRAPAPEREAEVAPAAPPPTGLRAWWQRYWTPLVVSAAAAAVIAALILQGKPDKVGGPGDDVELTNGAVAVESIQNEGDKTILVSMPAEDGEATVIWMLDEEEDEGQPDGGPAAGEDPI